MSQAAITAPETETERPSAGLDDLPPVKQPHKSGWQLFKEVLDHGGPGYVQFAITNLCNARCDFCNFAVDRLPRDQRKSVTLAEARDAIDIFAKNRIGYLLFVGGEPMAHRDLPAMVRYTAERGISPMICTNGSLWTDRNIRAYARHGLSSVIMSIDAHDLEAHEKNRGLPDVCRKIRDANRRFKELGIQSTASITASRLIEDYRRLPEFLQSLGFESCTFSYPLSTLASSYLSFSDSKLVSYTADELLEVFEKLKQLKASSAVPVINPRASLSDMQRHLRGQPEKFPCLGGYKYFYLDWKMQLYRCHFWETPMCSVYEFDQSKLIRDGCTRCMIDCYRDSSVLQYSAISVGDAWNHLKQGRLLAAARNILDYRNAIALREVWANRKFVVQV